MKRGWARANSSTVRRVAGRVMHDSQSHEWVFPAASRSGHVEEIKGTSWVDGKNGDKRKIVRLSKVGHSLRHSYRTLCAAAGLDRRRTKLLMNHQVSRDVTDAYLSTPALFDQLRQAQRTVSNLIARSASQDPDERLTRLLLSEVRGGAVSTMVSHAHSAISRSQSRHSGRSIEVQSLRQHRAQARRQGDPPATRRS